MSTSILVIVIGTVLINTFLLVSGEASSGSDRHRGIIANAIRIAGATLVTLLLAVIATIGLSISFISKILAYHVGDVMLLIYACTVVAITILLHRITRSRLPRLRRSLASSPVLIVSNSLALGSCLLGAVFLDAARNNTVMSLLMTAIALGIGFSILLIIFAALNERIADREVPTIFRQAPVTLISAGLTALALMGFIGLLRG